MDKNRRKFLKVVFIGSGLFIAGKILNPLLSKSLTKSLSEFSPQEKSSTKLLGESLPKEKSLTGLTGFLPKKKPAGFRVVENNVTFSVYDELGVEVLQIDKGV